MPKAVGRSCLTPLIGERGGIAGDFTVTRLAEDEFWIIGSGMAERYHQRFFKAVPLPEGTTFESRTDAMCGFNVAGPKSRDMLQRLTNTALATADFPSCGPSGSSWPVCAAGAAGSLHWRSGVGIALRARRSGALYAALMRRRRRRRGPCRQPCIDVAADRKGLRIMEP